MTEKQSKQDMQKILDEVADKKQAEAYQAKVSDSLAKMREQLDSMLESVTTSFRKLSINPEHQSPPTGPRETKRARAADETASEGCETPLRKRGNVDIQDPERQIQESPNNHVQRHIQELEQNLEKRNEQST